MHEIQQSFLLESLNKITRNYNSKNEGNTPILNTIFNWFDTDHNGTFNDDEWAKKEKYVQNLQAKLNTNYSESIGKETIVVKFYRKQLDSILKEIRQIDTQINKIYENENYFVQMSDFEKAHGIKRDGYIKKSGKPDNVITTDISMFETGVLDNKGEDLTGKTYKKGYIEFPDNISDEDKQAYLELLKKAQKQCSQVQKLMYKLKQSEKECHEAIKYYNMAKSGQIKKIDSQNNEAQVYQRNQAIRESSNPYYKQYKALEQKYNTLRLKPNLTDKEARLLIQYSQILQQLKAASSSWSSPQGSSGIGSGQKPKSVSETEIETESETETESESNIGFSITNIDEKISYEDGEFSNEHSVGVGYNQKKWNVVAAGSETGKYKPGKNEQEGFFTLAGTYNAGKFAVSPELGFSGTSSSTTWTPSLGVSYTGNSNSMSFKATREITKVKVASDNGENKSKNENETETEKEIEENLSGTTFATKLDFEWQKTFKNGIGTSVTSSAKFDKNQGNDYSLGLGVQSPLFKDKLAKHNLYMTAGANLSSSYEDLIHAATINPSISTSLGYNKNNFSAEVTCQENFSTILAGGESISNQMFTASGTIGYKQLSFKSGYSSTLNSYIDMTNIDTEVSWTTKKAGTYSAICGYTNTIVKESGETDKGFSVSLGYSAPMDFINNLFKSSKKK